MFNFSKLKKSSKLYDEIQQQIKDTESKNQIISSIWRARSAFHLSLLRCAARPLIKVQWGKVQSLQVPRSQCVSVCMSVCVCVYLYVKLSFLVLRVVCWLFSLLKTSSSPSQAPLPSTANQERATRENQRERERKRQRACSHLLRWPHISRRVEDRPSGEQPKMNNKAKNNDNENENKTNRVICRLSF